MKKAIHDGSRRYWLVSGPDVLSDAGHTAARRPCTAHSLVRGFMRDPINKLVLRQAYRESTLQPDVSRLSDEEIVARLARQVAAGHVKILGDEIAMASAASGVGGAPRGQGKVAGAPPAAPEVGVKPSATKPVVAPSVGPTPENVVTPKLELEYKVVLLDRELGQFQPDGEARTPTDPTYITVHAEQSNTGIPLRTGALLSCKPGKVRVFSDEACRNELPGDPFHGVELTAAQLTGGQPLKLYFKGKTAGKFEISLALQSPDNSAIKIQPPAKETMGVVELKLNVHRQDINMLKRLEVDPDTDPIATYHTNLRDLALPDQKEMTDREKIAEGRLLHVQKDGNFGRAKLTCPRLESRDWPGGTDGYEIVITQEVIGSGGLELFDAEFDGTKLDLPLKIPFADLKGADQTYWVQGKFFTGNRRDARLHLGLDRPEGGLAKKPKHHADWASFTVVTVKTVAVEYVAEAGRAAAWDSANNRFTINLAATWDARKKKFTTDANTDVNGRKITIAARLNEKIAGITVHFMLAPDKDNQKTANWGADMPATWKWKDIERKVKHMDKTFHKSLLHISATTDEKGYAKAELLLSRFGGDVFWPACYISEDPHLAKYVDGHADLEKRKPVRAANSVTVWRKFWYGEVRVAGINVAGFLDAADTYDDVKADMLAAPVETMTRKAADKIKPRVVYPKHMVSYYLNNANNYVNNYPGSGDDALVVGDDNESKFFKLAKPASDRPVMIPILNAHALWVADGLSSALDIGPFDATLFPIDIETDKELLDPPLQGGKLLRAGRWSAEDRDPASGNWVKKRGGKLQSGDIELDSGRSDPRVVRINQPAKLRLRPGVDTRVTITGFTVRGAVTYLGTSYDDGIVNSYTPNDVQDFVNTINHEIGHSFKQVTKVRPAGVPVHPHQYDKDGSHCRYTNKSCLMYESGPQPASLNRYCPVCHPYVLVQDMSKV